MLQSMGSQSIGHDWVTELNWTDTQVTNGLTEFYLSTLKLYFLTQGIFRNSNLEDSYICILTSQQNLKEYFKAFCCSVPQLYPTLCDPIDCSTPGLPVPYQLLMFAQVHVHCISDRDMSSTPGLGRSPGEGYGNPLQYSCQENPMDRGAWWVRRIKEVNTIEAT